MKRMILVAAIISAGHVNSAELLREITSDVIQADGMLAADILRRGGECLRSTAGLYADRVQVLTDADTVYATLDIGYQPDKDAPPLDQTIRSRMTIIAKDGRFKITQTDITQFFQIINTWSPIKASRADTMRARLKIQADSVELCIRTPSSVPASAGGDW